MNHLIQRLTSLAPLALLLVAVHCAPREEVWEGEINVGWRRGLDHEDLPTDISPSSSTTGEEEIVDPADSSMTSSDDSSSQPYPYFGHGYSKHVENSTHHRNATNLTNLFVPPPVYAPVPGYIGLNAQASSLAHSYIFPRHQQQKKARKKKQSKGKGKKNGK
jgi:hypothetical protein